MVESLERKIDLYIEEAPPLERFILPGGSEAATIHIARTVVRRAERSIVSLQKEVKINEVVLKYVNRLSDYLFAIARVINARLQVKDVEYNRSALVFRDKKRRKWSNSLSFLYTFSVIYQNREGMVVIRKRRMYMKVLKCGVMLLSILFVSQLHVYAEENRWTWPVEGQISDYFGTRHGKHYGIDVVAPIGTPVALSKMVR